MTRLSTILTIAASIGPGIARAQHAGDILLTVQEGRLATGAVLPSGAFDLDERLFISVLGVAFPNFSDSPGFDSLPGTFTPQASVGFRFLAALREWNGSDFGTIPEEQIGASFGPLGPVLTPLTDQVVTGFTIRAGANGQWHRHLEYELLSPADSGLYLAEFSLFTTSPGVDESLPFWIIFDQNADPIERERAVAWVLSNKLCPADFNADGFPDGFDYDDFVTCFEGIACPSGRSADFNNDGFADGFDYDDFVSAFEAGC